MTPFTHPDDAGHARMVDVTGKRPTVREAKAGRVRCSAAHGVRVCEVRVRTRAEEG